MNEEQRNKIVTNGVKMVADNINNLVYGLKDPGILIFNIVTALSATTIISYGEKEQIGAVRNDFIGGIDFHLKRLMNNEIRCECK